MRRLIFTIALCLVSAAACKGQQQTPGAGGSTVTVASITGPLPAGTNVIGHVLMDSGSTTVVTGTVTVGGTVTFSNSGFNVNNFPALQPVSSTQLPAALDGSGFFKVHEQGTALVDVSDRTARLMGHVTVDSAPTTAVTIASMPSTPVTGTFFQGTQPVSIAATVNTDPIDRSARLLGHVTVDSAPAVTGTVTDQGTDSAGNKNTLPVVQGAVIVQPSGLPLPPCNPVRTLNCKHN